MEFDVRTRATTREHIDPASTAREAAADKLVHLIGLGLGIPAAIVIVLLGASGQAVHPAAIAVYALGLVAMLACSAAYNVWRTSPRREWLRRFDHAAIFAMIAGTYTPFTTLDLGKASSTGLTALVWAMAGLGMIGKLCQPRLIEAISVVLYLALGWIGLIALEPFVEGLETTTLVLLLGGGIIYSAGVVFHLWRTLPYHNAIWHGFVLVAASVHYAAVLTVSI